MSVWADVVGQETAVVTLREAAQQARQLAENFSEGAAADTSLRAMTHAWLITGPPGSGRSNAARAFCSSLAMHTPQ